MLALRAVKPQRFGVVEHDGVCWEHAGSGRRRDGHEAGVKARHVLLNHADGSTGLVERRLCHGVIARNELELHAVAFGGGDLVGRVD